jgi:hypothetical protein
MFTQLETKSPSEALLTTAILALLSICICISSSNQVVGRESKHHSFRRALHNDGFAQFWSNFYSASRQNDKARVANSSTFPFKYQDDEWDRSEFIEKFQLSEDCDQNYAIEKSNNRYVVTCGLNYYFFDRIGGDWSFTAYGWDH